MERGASRRLRDERKGGGKGALPPSDVSDAEVAYHHRILKERLESRFGEVRRAFRMVDEDASGTCDRDELKFSLNAMFNLDRKSVV